MAAKSSMEADGFACVREPRQSLMRRAVTAIDGESSEIRLRNISSRARWLNAAFRFPPATQLTIDIVGVGPVVGTVRWSQNNRFGIQFDEEFDMRRLAPRVEKRSDGQMIRPWYVEKAAVQSGQLARQNASTARAMTLSAPASTLRRNALASVSSYTP